MSKIDNTKAIEENEPTPEDIEEIRDSERRKHAAIKISRNKDTWSTQFVPGEGLYIPNTIWNGHDYQGYYSKIPMDTLREIVNYVIQENKEDTTK